jgi:DnaJ-class molecular chaperone
LSTLDYYSILELQKDASSADIKKSYRRLSKKFHPDKNKDGEEQFKKIAEAYSVLGDPTKKEAYDGRGSRPNINFDSFSDFYNNFTTFRNAPIRDFSYLNVQIDRHFKISELMDGIDLTVNYQVSKASLTDSKFEDRSVKLKVNLSTTAYPLMNIDGQIGLILRVRHAGSSQTVEQFDFIGTKSTGTVTGDLFVRIYIDAQDLEFSETSDLVQNVKLTLAQVLFDDEIVLENPMCKKYKVNFVNSTVLSDLRVKIPEQGLVAASGRKGSYIFKISIIKPDFSKISEDKLTLLKELLSTPNK